MLITVVWTCIDYKKAQRKVQKVTAHTLHAANMLGRIYPYYIFCFIQYDL